MTWWMYILGGLIVLAIGYGIGFWYADRMVRRGQSSFYGDYIDRGAQQNTTVRNKPKGQAPTNLPVNLNMDKKEENE